MNISSFSFYFNDCRYEALVRTKNKRDGRNEHYITVMNGELEKLLFGNHLFIESGDVLLAEEGEQTEPVRSLRAAIRPALEFYLRTGAVMSKDDFLERA